MGTSEPGVQPDGIFEIFDRQRPPLQRPGNESGVEQRGRARCDVLPRRGKHVQRFLEAILTNQQAEFALVSALQRRIERDGQIVMIVRLLIIPPLLVNHRDV